MKKKLLALFAFVPFLMEYLSCSKQKAKKFAFYRIIAFLFLFFISLTCWSQPPPPHTFTSNGSLLVPAGITEVDVQAWGGGGAGGGASGGALLTGSRSAAGGGGGAYAHAKITVTAGTTLNAIVAGATTNSLSSTNTALDGAAGGHSTITGYENLIFAAGGAGGGANVGTAPSGGQRGLDSNSKGALGRTSGTDGGSGYTGAIGLLQISGAGGNGGLPGGGTGGASIGSVLLGSSDGKDGVAPGGGGSGAMNAYSNHKGGSGAPGQVIVTYTCPTYSITGVSAAAVCTTLGTSEIILSGTSAGLPTGVYVVSYRLGNPAANPVHTAAMTVSVAGTGKFTISGFNTPGTNRITITNLTSGVCSSNIANLYSDFTIYGASVAGTIGAVAPICSGASSPALSLTGNTGLVLNWESSVSPFTTWTPISNTTTNYSPGVLTQTTQFRVVVQNGPCSSITSTALAVTVNPLPQGSLTANGPFCATGSGLLTFNSTVGTGPFTIIYKENGGANQTKTGVTSGTPFAPTTATVSTTTTYTLVSVTDSKSCLRTSGFSGTSPVITVNTIPTPTFVSPPAGSVCARSPVTYTTQAGQSNYVWTVPGTAGMDYNILSGGIAANSNTVTVEWLSLGNKTVTVNYTSSGCTGVTIASNTITVIRTVPGVVNGGQHICAGNASPLLTLNSYVGTIVRWEYAEAIPYVWQPIAHTGATFQPGILTTSTSYRAIIKNGSCSEDSAIETRIDVDPRPATPRLGAIVQPTCVNPLGSILLNGLIGSASWIINQTGTAYQTYNGSGNTFSVPNLAPGNYTFTIQENSGCPSLATISVAINAPITNTWNGTAWSEGREPLMTDAIVFSGNYQTTGNLAGCSCIVNSGVNVTVNSNHTLTIANSVNNNGGTLTFENNSSLLQTTNAINTGNIIYKRNTQPVRRYDFTYWSSPVKRTPAFTMHDLSPGTLLDKYNHYDANATSSGWVISLNGTQEMLPAVGYTIRAPQTFDINIPAVYPATFVGVPNNGPYSFSLAGAGKWNLIGNPYPSAVYADQFIYDNRDNLYGTLYFWTHNSAPAGSQNASYNSNDYAPYNLTGSISIGNMSGTGATTPGNNAAPLGYIAAGQSFFVVSKTAGNAVFNNGMRVPGNNSQFYKNKSAKLEKNRVWINLTNTQGAFKQLLIGYIEGATNSWDTNYDAVTMNANPYLDFYSINEDMKLVVQGRALPFVDTDVIPLGYKTTIVGDFTIAIDYADGKLTSQPIFLEDKTTNVWHDLRASDYTFSTVIGTFSDRFVLHYTGKSLGVDEFENTENAVLVSVKDKNITIKSAKENLTQVAIFDISGKMLYQKNKIENSELQITNLQSGNQVLLVKTTLENGNVITKKIVF